MKLSWIDITRLGAERDAIVAEALNNGIDGIVSEDPADLAGLPPIVRRVYLMRYETDVPADLAADVLIVGKTITEGLDALREAHPGLEVGRYVEIVDADSLQEACVAARDEKWSILDFADPTKIPLEIVLAAADKAEGSTVTIAHDITEADIIFGVLERGSDGVLLAPRNVGDATALREVATRGSDPLALVELEITAVNHVGMGERACVDTCTQFRQDEGILVGSRSTGMILCVSETHPLPYMPTRPFRVNAGAIHSYTIGVDGRTNYLSELRAGHRVTAVDVQGNTREVTVGRVKIESRPLLSIDAVAPNGQTVNLILQDDWHVRVLGAGGRVHNSTELVPGDKVLGHLPVGQRHVGYPINEFCLEQ